MADQAMIIPRATSRPGVWSRTARGWCSSPATRAPARPPSSAISRRTSLCGTWSSRPRAWRRSTPAGPPSTPSSASRPASRIPITCASPRSPDLSEARAHHHRRGLHAPRRHARQHRRLPAHLQRGLLAVRRRAHPAARRHVPAPAGRVAGRTGGARRARIRDSLLLQRRVPAGPGHRPRRTRRDLPPDRPGVRLPAQPRPGGRGHPGGHRPPQRVLRRAGRRPRHHPHLHQRRRGCHQRRSTAEARLRGAPVPGGDGGQVRARWRPSAVTRWSCASSRAPG